MKFTVLIIWLVLFVAVMNFCLDMMSLANTIENVFAGMSNVNCMQQPLNTIQTYI